MTAKYKQRINSLYGSNRKLTWIDRISLLKLYKKCGIISIPRQLFKRRSEHGNY